MRTKTEEDQIVLFNTTERVPDRYPESPIHYNLRTLSYSGLLTLHSCPRKFELNRYLPAPNDPEYDEDAAGHLDFGTVVGNGVQELLITNDINKAMFRAFLDWKDNLDSERGATNNKTFWHALQAITKFTEIMNGPLAQYELVQYQGKPAVELGFAVDCGEGFTLRGKLDALLIHKTKRSFLPLECKTTGMSYIDEASYKNSSQGTGYGVIIDRVAHELQEISNSYDIFYPIYMTKKQDWMPFKFNKNLKIRANWLQDILLDIAAIKQYSDLDFFPARGEACFSYGRQCRHFGSCGMSTESLTGGVENIPVKLDKADEYILQFTMQELIDAQYSK
jgi:hypothetical protein